MGRKKANEIVQSYNELRKKYNDNIRYIEKIYNTHDDKHYTQRQAIQKYINEGYFKVEVDKVTLESKFKRFGSISKLDINKQEMRLNELKSINSSRFSMKNINEFKDKVIENTKKKYGLTGEYENELSDDQILNVVLFDDYEDYDEYFSQSQDAVYEALTGNLDELRDRFIRIARKLG